jgi:hypothetical protein
MANGIVKSLKHAGVVLQHSVSLFPNRAHVWNERIRYRMNNEVEGVAEEEADALLYVGFTVTWTLIRSALESQGIYANHRDRYLEDFERTYGKLIELAPFRLLFKAWDQRFRCANNHIIDLGVWSELKKIPSAFLYLGPDFQENAAFDFFQPCFR